MKERLILLTIMAGILLVFLNRHRIVDALQFGEGRGGGTGRSLELADEAAARVMPLLKAELSAMGLEPGYPVFVRIFKEAGDLELWMQEPGEGTFVLYKTYRLCKVPGGAGPKLKAGDDQVPEGFYHVASKQLLPKGGNHLAFDLGYPNAYDRYHTRSGKKVRVEGGCEPEGAFAMGDEGIEEVFTLARASLEGGQKFFRVHCFPFRMTDARMDEELEAKSEWIDFWANLKEGYDYFELLRKPPDTTLKAGRYFFE